MSNDAPCGRTPRRSRTISCEAGDGAAGPAELGAKRSRAQSMFEARKGLLSLQSEGGFCRQTSGTAQTSKSFSRQSSGVGQEEKRQVELANIRVAVRIRPMASREDGQRDGVQIGDGAIGLIDYRGQERAFAVDSIFDSRNDTRGKDGSTQMAGEGTQRAVFESIGSEIVRQTLDGYHSCFLAYGHTGSGKTYTVFGDDAASWCCGGAAAGLSSPALPAKPSDSPTAGLLPRALEAIFAALGDDEAVACVVSFYEVYNERVRDLLDNAPMGGIDLATETFKPPRRPTVHFFPNVGAFVSDLTEVHCGGLHDALGAMARGIQNRSCSPTALNIVSSRSHAIFTVRVERQDSVSAMTMVDLSGREQERSTQCRGERFKELTLINRSLFHLARCVRMLASQNASSASAIFSSGQGHTFRNSKLTMLLGHALAGNSRTALVGTVSPARSAHEDSLATLRFLDSVKQVRTRPVINDTACENTGASMLQNEVKRLESELQQAHRGREMMEQQLCEAQTMLEHYKSSWKQAMTEEGRKQDLENLRSEASCAPSPRRRFEAVSEDCGGECEAPCRREPSADSEKSDGDSSHAASTTASEEESSASTPREVSTSTACPNDEDLLRAAEQWLEASEVHSHAPAGPRRARLLDTAQRLRAELALELGSEPSASSSSSMGARSHHMSHSVGHTPRDAPARGPLSAKVAPSARAAAIPQQAATLPRRRPATATPVPRLQLHQVARNAEHPPAVSPRPLTERAVRTSSWADHLAGPPPTDRLMDRPRRRPDWKFVDAAPTVTLASPRMRSPRDTRQPETYVRIPMRLIRSERYLTPTRGRTTHEVLHWAPAAKCWAHELLMPREVSAKHRLPVSGVAATAAPLLGAG